MRWDWNASHLTNTTASRYLWKIDSDSFLRTEVLEAAVRALPLEHRHPLFLGRRLPGRIYGALTQQQDACRHAPASGMWINAGAGWVLSAEIVRWLATSDQLPKDLYACTVCVALICCACAL